MQDMLAGLVDELRAVGIAVSVGEHLDAARALSGLSLRDKDVVRAALQCALVKRADQLATFNLLFELHTSGASQPGAEPMAAMSDQELRDALRAAIVARDARMLRLLADEYVRRFGGLEPGSPVAGVFAAIAVDDAAGLDRLRAELLDGQGEPGAGGGGAGGDNSNSGGGGGAGGDNSNSGGEGGAGGDNGNGGGGGGAGGDNSNSGGGGGGGAGGQGGDNSNWSGGSVARAIRARLAEAAADRAIEAFRADLRAAIRRALVADRGARAVRATMRVGLAQDADIAGASAAELAEMAATIGPLAQRLTYELAQLGAFRKRTLSIRRTLHLAMGTGGVPFRLATEPVRPPRPEIVVLCDMSGSVSAYSRFTLDLLIALDSRLNRLRVFAFVDDVAEITDLVREARASGRRLGPREAAAGAVRLGGSDYGFVLRQFASRHARQLTKRSVVLVVGDARTNYLDPAQAAFAEIAERAGQVYWLNPEPRRLWNEGDSVIARYAPWCVQVRECRTPRQIADFVQSLAAGRAVTGSPASAAPFRM